LMTVSICERLIVLPDVGDWLMATGVTLY